MIVREGRMSAQLTTPGGSSDAASALDALAVEQGAAGDWLPMRHRFGLWRAVRRSPMNMLGAFLVLVTLIVSLIGELVSPYSPIVPSYGAILTAPAAAHFFGTDELGRDVFSRILSGAHLSLQIAVIVVGIGTVVGTTIGLIAGYSGGWADEVLMRATDIFLAFPVLVLAMAIAGTLGPSLGHTILALTALWWPWYARLIRGQVLSLREREYIEAARAVGVAPLRVMWRHVLPNTLPPLIVQMSLDIGYAILAAASLSFIGLGVQAPTPDWGLMISDAQNYVRSAWWVGAFPGLAIVLAVLGFNLLGDTLNDFLDPRRES